MNARRTVSPCDCPVILFAVAFLLLLAAAGGIAALSGGEDIQRFLRFYARDAIRIAWQCGIPILILLVMRKQPELLGLAPGRFEPALRALWPGAVPFFAAVLLLNFARGAFRHYQDLTLPAAVMNTAYFFIVNAFAEEIFFRGLVQTLVIRLLGRAWLGVAITSLLFGLYHIPMFGWTLPGCVAPMMGGLIFGYAFIRSGSILTPWFLHGLADTALLSETLGTYVLLCLAG